MIGRTIGEYKVIDAMGADPFGTVYYAQHVSKGWHVALRHFKPELCDVSIMKAYVAGATGAMHSGNPCILNVVDSFWSGRNFFVASELVEGETLAEAVRRARRLFPELGVKLGWQIANAVAQAHAVGVIHKALRLDSVYVAPDPDWPGGFRTKIVDFGAGAFLESGTPDWRSPRVEALGLPFTISPEQIRSGYADHRSDIYSFGCMLFHMACGRPPYLGQSPYDLATAHTQTVPRGPLSIEGSVLPEVDALVLRMIQKEPLERPQTMAEVVTELERIAHARWPAAAALKTVQVKLDLSHGPSGRGRRRWLVVMIAALLAAGIGTGVALAVRHNAHPVAAVPDAAPAPAVVASSSAPPPPPDAGISELDQHLSQARKALAAENFSGALDEAKAAAKLDPKNTEAQSLITLAKAEPGNKKLFDDFNKLTNDKDTAKTVKAYRKIPLESVYHDKATPAYEQLRDAFVHGRELEAKAFAEHKACARIVVIEKEVRDLFPESVSGIEDVRKSCLQR